MSGDAVVAVLGTLDTKGAETEYLRERIARTGQRPLVIDTGVQGAPRGVAADVGREAVAEAAGTTLDALRAANDRGQAVAAMGRGAAAVVAGLHRTGRLAGVVGLGGHQHRRGRAAGASGRTAQADRVHDGVG